MAARALLVCFASLHLVGAVLKLPPSIQLCKKNDPNLNDCIRKSFNDAISLIAKGIPEIGLEPMDPLIIKQFRMQKGGMDLKVWDATVTGLGTVTIFTVDADLEKGRIAFTLQSKESIMEGDYELDGNFNGAPLQGKGKINVGFYGFGGLFVVQGKIIEKNGKHYLDAQDMQVDLHRADLFTINFQGLFGGDKEKEDAVNKAFNENWTALWETARDDFNGKFAEVLYDGAKHVFDHVALEDIFLE